MNSIKANFFKLISVSCLFLLVGCNANTEQVEKSGAVLDTANAVEVNGVEPAEPEELEPVVEEVFQDVPFEVLFPPHLPQIDGPIRLTISNVTTDTQYSTLVKDLASNYVRFEIEIENISDSEVPLSPLSIGRSSNFYVVDKQGLKHKLDSANFEEHTGYQDQSDLMPGSKVSYIYSAYIGDDVNLTELILASHYDFNIADQYIIELTKND